MKINKRIYMVIKRIIDIISALIGCILLIPITLIIWIIRKIYKEDDGPLFYKQIRYGKNGKMFEIVKYRTMCIDADKDLDDYLKSNPNAKEEFEKYQKLSNDPRITKFGKLLRKTSLDEFPQFINILKGDLSLIGPRPIVETEIEKYGNNKEKFLSIKPGLTGYWAANGRSDTSYEERMQMELYYVDNVGLLLDIEIFFKTIITVLRKEGAI